jgi:hypothetical protein
MFGVAREHLCFNKLDDNEIKQVFEILDNHVHSALVKLSR